MKGNLLQGTARGKLGNIVAKVVHGKQILANYQPNVTNPNTELQQGQREKFRYANFYLKGELAKNPRQYKGIPYSLYMGSSKSSFNALMRQSLFAFDCSLKHGSATRTQKPRQSPMFFEPKTTGNHFPIEVTNTGVIQFIDTTPGDMYFGSDIALNNADCDIVLFYTTQSETNDKISLQKEGMIDFPSLVPELAPAVQGFKQMGFQATKEACGDWNFYYKIKIAPLGGVSKLPALIDIGEDLGETGKYLGAHMLFLYRDSIIDYSFAEYWKQPIETPPAP